MAKPRTHFEQVPLEIVKKIVGEEIPPDATTEREPKTKRQKIEKDLLGNKKKFAASSRRSSQLELSE
jgi:hypothetical protein